MSALDLNRSLIDAASWRLASELCLRHPELQLIKMHPGGGMYDVLCLYSGDHGSDGSPPQAGAKIMLNRAGTIQVHGRADGRGPTMPPTSWSDYLGEAEPANFMRYLEDAAGLQDPQDTALTPRAAVFMTIAGLTNMCSMSEPLEISEGYLDSSGGSGPADWWPLMVALDPELTSRRAIASPSLEYQSDLLGQAGYRFWRVQGTEIDLVLETSSGSMFRLQDVDLETIDENFDLDGIRPDQWGNLLEGLPQAGRGARTPVMRLRGEPGYTMRLVVNALEFGRT